jgi:hypothetical protein
VGAALLVLLVLLLVWRIVRQRSFSADFFHGSSADMMEMNSLLVEKVASLFALSFAAFFTAEDLAATRRDFADLEVPRKNIKLDRLIGRGQSGQVHLATLAMSPANIRPVAVKIHASDGVADAQTSGEEALQLEARLLHQLRHSHIVQVLATVTKSFPTWICLEYMQNGDLKNYLR